MNASPRRPISNALSDGKPLDAGKFLRGRASHRTFVGLPLSAWPRFQYEGRKVIFDYGRRAKLFMPNAKVAPAGNSAVADSSFDSISSLYLNTKGMFLAGIRSRRRCRPSSAGTQEENATRRRFS